MPRKPDQGSPRKLSQLPPCNREHVARQSRYAVVQRLSAVHQVIAACCVPASCSSFGPGGQRRARAGAVVVPHSRLAPSRPATRRRNSSKPTSPLPPDNSLPMRTAWVRRPSLVMPAPLGRIRSRSTEENRSRWIGQLSFLLQSRAPCLPLVAPVWRPDGTYAGPHAPELQIRGLPQEALHAPTPHSREPGPDLGIAGDCLRGPFTPEWGDP